MRWDESDCILYQANCHPRISINAELFLDCRGGEIDFSKRNISFLRHPKCSLCQSSSQLVVNQFFPSRIPKAVSVVFHIHSSHSSEGTVIVRVYFLLRASTDSNYQFSGRILSNDGDDNEKRESHFRKCHNNRKSTKVRNTELSVLIIIRNSHNNINKNNNIRLRSYFSLVGISSGSLKYSPGSSPLESFRDCACCTPALFSVW